MESYKAIKYTRPEQSLNYSADMLHCLGNGSNNSCIHKAKDLPMCGCGCKAVCQQDLAPGVTLEAIIHSSALYLTFDLPRRISVMQLNVSRPLSDHWGQA